MNGYESGKEDFSVGQRWNGFNICDALGQYGFIKMLAIRNTTHKYTENSMDFTKIRGQKDYL